MSIFFIKVIFSIILFIHYLRIHFHNHPFIDFNLLYLLHLYVLFITYYLYVILIIFHLYYLSMTFLMYIFSLILLNLSISITILFLYLN